MYEREQWVTLSTQVICKGNIISVQSRDLQVFVFNNPLWSVHVYIYILIFSIVNQMDNKIMTCFMTFSLLLFSMHLHLSHNQNANYIKYNKLLYLLRLSLFTLWTEHCYVDQIAEVHKEKFSLISTFIIILLKAGWIEGFVSIVYAEDDARCCKYLTDGSKRTH